MPSMMPSNFLPAAFWGYWCQYIWINRYALIPSDLYERLLSLVRVKDYFILTTNVDHSFQRSGFDKRNFFLYAGRLWLVSEQLPKRHSQDQDL